MLKIFFRGPEGSNKHFWKENEVPKVIPNFSLANLTDFRIFTFSQTDTPGSHVRPNPYLFFIPISKMNRWRLIFVKINESRKAYRDSNKDKLKA